ncbi:MAG TPA: PIG-L family deacetylase [Steroidobacteraceae bacterium]|nr:PIG-L family deacetylase [Steroidobacteraceae bacterium]
MLRPGVKKMALPFLAWLAALAAAAHAGTAPAALPPIDASTSLLVIAPHPDDETLCCAGVIERVVRAGGHASVVWITSGDGSELNLLFIERSLFRSPKKMQELAERRMREARAATALLGLRGADQLFLGYPDGGVLALLEGHYTRAYTSPFTGASAVPYPDALFPGHAYSGASLEQDLDAVLDRVRPTLLLTASPRDAHPDHRAAGLLTLHLMARRGQLAAVRCWVVHGGEGWPSPRQLSPGLPLTPAPLLAGVPVAAFELTPAEEDRKLEALRAYPTQLEMLSPLLLAFVRTTELFSAAPSP